MRLFGPLLASGAAAFASVAMNAQDWRADFSSTWAENLSRTSNASDRENAALYDGSVSAEWHRQLAPDWSVLLQGETGFEQVRAFAGLDSVHAGGRVDLRRKFGLGPFAPVLTFNGGASRYDLHERGRSHWQVEGGVTLSKRLTESWRVSAGGRWDEDYARDHPFDVINHRLSLETSWDFLDGWQLGAGASRLWGELTANANEDVFQQARAGSLGPVVAAYYNTVPFEHSTAFDTDWVAYRIDCRADIWWLGLTVSLGENTSLPLRYEAVKVVNRANVGYDSEFWSLSIVRRF
jgi:hypothetical protein